MRASRSRRKVPSGDKGAAPQPVTAALVATSPLVSKVESGLQALSRDARHAIEDTLRREFYESLDIDEALRAENPQSHRWDYLLGHGPLACVIALEPHSARTDQIQTVIDKREAAKAQLRSHLKPGARIAAWLWVSSGENQFADTERARRSLDQHGIKFVGKTVQRKHLPG